MNDWQVIGIDPAPTKPAMLYFEGDWLRLQPTEIRDFIAGRMRSNPKTLVAWDAPLSFDPNNLNDRTVDKVVRKWAKSNRRFEEKAINARCFAGLPHWVVSCVALGLPFGTPNSGLQLAPKAPDRSCTTPLVIEVHPAVALGAWWLQSNCPDPMPRYKGNIPASERIKALKRIVEVLKFPPQSGKDDDHLDSFVAHRLGELFVHRKAHWLGSPSSGGYVMPDCPATTELAADPRLKFVG